MYTFRDINDASDNAVMPSEALKLNGEYIENLIPGYRTLYTKGREALSPEFAYYETGIRDGATAQNKRYPARIITVGYQLLAESNEAFRSAFNALGGILDVEDAQLIFDDEQDKYFTGTPSLIGEIEPGRNQVVGEIEFTCTDPFKYSVEEYEVVPTLDDGMAFLANYNGTYKAFPELEADFYSESGDALTGNGDCGYVAFFNEYGKIIQLGDPEEEDGEGMAQSQTLANQLFKTEDAWGTAAQKLWPLNSGVSTEAFSQTGSMKTAKSHATAGAEGYYLTPAGYGTGTKYHGPSITRVLPADSAGVTGATNFTCTWKQKLCIGDGKNDIKQKGGFQILLTNASNTIVAGVSVFKGSSGKKAKLRFFVGGKTKETIEIDISYHNKRFGNNRSENKKKKIEAIKTVKTSSIVKTGSKVVFTIGGKKKTFTDSAIADMAVTRVTVTMAARDTSTPLTHNGLYWVKFIKNNCDTWRDIKNKFSADDVVIANCKNGEVLLNDSPAPELGALGNDWEEFYLQPGANQIGVSYSEWVEDAYAPTFKMRYREVFL